MLKQVENSFIQAKFYVNTNKGTLIAPFNWFDLRKLDVERFNKLHYKGK